MTAVPKFSVKSHIGRSTPAITEQQLVDHASRGSAEAFGELVRRYQQQVRGYLSRQIFDAAAVDDVAQEVFIGAMNQVSGLNNRQSFRSWLMTIARNKCIDYLRCKARPANHSSAQIEQLLAAEALSQFQRADLPDLEQRDVLLALQHCLRQLPPKSHGMLTAFYFQNQTAPQLAATFNKKPGAIRMALLRIRNSLARCIRRKLGRDIA